MGHKRKFKLGDIVKVNYDHQILKDKLAVVENYGYDPNVGCSLYQIIFDFGIPVSKNYSYKETAIGEEYLEKSTLEEFFIQYPLKSDLIKTDDLLYCNHVVPYYNKRYIEVKQIYYISLIKEKIILIFLDKNNHFYNLSGGLEKVVINDATDLLKYIEMDDRIIQHLDKNQIEKYRDIVEMQRDFALFND